jgi:hypothetical protein
LQASLKWNDEKIPDEPVVMMVFSDSKLPKIALPVYIILDTEAKP